METWALAVDVSIQMSLKQEGLKYIPTFPSSLTAIAFTILDIKTAKQSRDRGE